MNPGFFPRVITSSALNHSLLRKRGFFRNRSEGGGLNPSDSFLNGYIFIFLLTGGAS
jgi:hypothetical protein